MNCLLPGFMFLAVLGVCVPSSASAPAGQNELVIGPIREPDIDAVSIAHLLNAKSDAPIHFLISADVGRMRFDLDLSDGATLLDLIESLKGKVKDIRAIPAGRGQVLVGGIDYERLEWASPPRRTDARRTVPLSEAIRTHAVPKGYWCAPPAENDGMRVHLPPKHDSRGPALIAELADQANVAVVMVIDPQPEDVTITTHRSYDVSSRRFSPPTHEVVARREGSVWWTICHGGTK